MTIEERMANIDKAVEEHERAKKEKKDKEIAELDRLTDECYEYSDRVKELIKLARYCVNKGIKIPIMRLGDVSGYNSAEKYGYPHEFFAEGIHHHVGFMTKGSRYDIKPDIIGIGIENGGACGKWDFFWDGGKNMYSQYEDDSTRTEPVHTNDLKKFLREFESFEKAFYNFVDSL